MNNATQGMLLNDIQLELKRLGMVLFFSLKGNPVYLRGDTKILRLYKTSCTCRQCDMVEFDLDYTMLSNIMLNRILNNLKTQ